MKTNKKELKEKSKNLIKEFKAFIAKGNVLDMAIGVIIGGAFNKIVTSLVNILMSVCTWGVPGGINGLVTVLPATQDAQKGYDIANGLGQKFSASELQTLATNLANTTYTTEVVNANPTLIEDVKATILSKYTLFGNTYVYNLSAIIDWGSFINAIISFFLIALTLFVILKVSTRVNQARAKMKEDLENKIKELNKEEQADKKEESAK